MPYKAKPCPKCGKSIQSNYKTCRGCIDWKSINNVPEVYTLVRHCQQCSQPFTISHSRQYFCDKCRTFTCVVCGIEFKQSTTKGCVTCSYKCRMIHKSPPILTCEYCMEQFPQRGGSKTKYCSKDCRYIAAQVDLPDKKRNSWKYRQWRSAVFDRDNYTCQHCTSTSKLQSHHILSWSNHIGLRYDISNGLTLCITCHTITHGGKPTGKNGYNLTLCLDCNKPLKGRGKTPYCQPCSTRHHPTK